MNKLYLILFSTNLKREDLTAYFDTQRATIKFWFYSLPSSVFVRSNYSAQEIQDFIQKRFGTAANIIVVELQKGGNYAGWIPTEHIKYF